MGTAWNCDYYMGTQKPEGTENFFFFLNPEIFQSLINYKADLKKKKKKILVGKKVRISVGMNFR